MYHLKWRPWNQRPLVLRPFGSSFPCALSSVSHHLLFAAFPFPLPPFAFASLFIFSPLLPSASFSPFPPSAFHSLLLFPLPLPLTNLSLSLFLPLTSFCLFLLLIRVENIPKRTFTYARSHSLCRIYLVGMPIVVNQSSNAYIYIIMAHPMVIAAVNECTRLIHCKSKAVLLIYSHDTYNKQELHATRWSPFFTHCWFRGY